MRAGPHAAWPGDCQVTVRLVQQIVMAPAVYQSVLSAGTNCGSDTRYRVGRQTLTVIHGPLEGGEAAREQLQTRELGALLALGEGLQAEGTASAKVLGLEEMGNV